MAAEELKAKAEEALKRSRPSESKQTAYVPKVIKSDTPPPRSVVPASTSKRPKPSKVSSLFHNVILGLNVQARSWEAPTKDLIALNQARRTLGNHTFGEDKRTRALTALLNEVRARGGDDADTIKVLRDLVDRKITEEEAEKKIKELQDGKKSDSKGMSLAEQEELARLEIKAQQLILQKLVGNNSIINVCTLLTVLAYQELERREEERKEVEEIQKRIREKSLPIRLSRHVSTVTPTHK